MADVRDVWRAHVVTHPAPVASGSVTGARGILLRVPSIPTRQLVLYAFAAAVVLFVGWRYQPGSSSGQTYGPASSSVSTPAPAATADATVVVVDVSGAVRRPGVYRLASGARVLQAVRRAGARPKADLGAVNLAARLTDGEQIVVPVRGRAGQAAASADAGGTAAPAAPVSINSGTLEQLETLDGIGPSLAQRIVDYRIAHGGFKSLAELDQVSGIGPARLAALHGHITL
jgi:competence protein ComEA